MNKTVTIQEAIKANEHSRVRIVGQINYYGVKVLTICEYFRLEMILAEWEIEEKPLELYALLDKDGSLITTFLTKEKADEFAKSRLYGNFYRCVKMREVVE